MPVDTTLLVDTLSSVARNRNVMVSAQQSVKAGAIAGTSVVVGTMLGGPIGLVLGGIVGTTLAYRSTGPVKPLWEIINEDMTTAQKAQLVAQVTAAFRNFQYTDVAMLATMIMASSSMQDTAMRIALDFARNQITG